MADLVGNGGRAIESGDLGSSVRLETVAGLGQGPSSAARAIEAGDSRAGPGASSVAGLEDSWGHGHPGRPGG